jgi:hypothetical protein
MSGVDLSSVRDWVHKVNMLPALKTLSLSRCGLNTTVSALNPLNLTRLQVLDLSFNEFNSGLVQLPESGTPDFALLFLFANNCPNID